MSLAAPTQFAVSGKGITAFNIAVVWSVNVAGSTMTVNANVHPMADAYNNPLSLLTDLAIAAGIAIPGGPAGSTGGVEGLLQLIQSLVLLYTLGIPAQPWTIAIT